MTIRDSKAPPLANRIGSQPRFEHALGIQLQASRFLDLAGAAGVFDDLRNVTHDADDTELNSQFQASNSLTPFFPAQFDPRIVQDFFSGFLIRPYCIGNLIPA